jgi:hypothetical protein
LLTRLDALARRFPGHAIEIVSGYRPRARRTSRHRHGRALDLRVIGVSKETVTRFARTLEATGVGYYPNSHFTHIDVRAQRFHWVDRSGPGEPADYGVWPPPPTEVAERRAQILAEAREAAGMTTPVTIAAPSQPEAVSAPSPGANAASAQLEDASGEHPPSAKEYRRVRDAILASIRSAASQP